MKIWFPQLHAMDALNVIPAQAGIQNQGVPNLWFPAFAGMTVNKG